MRARHHEVQVGGGAGEFELVGRVFDHAVDEIDLLESHSRSDTALGGRVRDIGGEKHAADASRLQAGQVKYAQFAVGHFQQAALGGEVNSTILDQLGDTPALIFMNLIFQPMFAQGMAGMVRHSLKPASDRNRILFSLPAPLETPDGSLRPGGRRRRWSICCRVSCALRNSAVRASTASSRRRRAAA